MASSCITGPLTRGLVLKNSKITKLQRVPAQSRTLRIVHPVAAIYHQRDGIVVKRNVLSRPRSLSNSTRCEVAAGADLSVVEEDEEAGLLAFLTSERAKVVAMVAIAMALCNADRVVMSVAIVPMAAAHGWSQSFAGIVQVRNYYQSPSVS